MSSTGEVGCIGDTFDDAILESMLSVGYRIPKKNVLISSGGARAKLELLDAARLLKGKGYNLYATHGTQKYLQDNGVESTLLYWPDENQQPNVVDYIREKKIDLVINIPKDLTHNELANGYKIRRDAIDFNVPLITNARLASAFIKAFCKKGADDLQIKSWDEY